jgi:ABC-type multidrug transport system permease subunit
MSIKEELGNARAQFKLLSLYQRFEHVVITILTALIAIIVVVAVWNLTLKIVFGLILPGNLDPSDYAIFQGYLA